MCVCVLAYEAVSSESASLFPHPQSVVRREKHTLVRGVRQMSGKEGESHNFPLCDIGKEEWDRRQGDGVTCCNNRLLFMFEQVIVC